MSAASERTIRVNSEVITLTEIQAIDYILRTNPERYLSNASLHPRKESLERTLRLVAEDHGDIVAKKVAKDPFFLRFGIRSFYEAVYEWTVGLEANKVYSSESDYVSTRSYVHQIHHCSKDGLVIKSYQGGDEERKIAVIASEKEFGPNVHVASAKELVEEYLGEEGIPKLHPFELGTQFGNLLRKAHNEGIIYGDSIQRHSRYDPKEKRMKLIDFGMSFRVNRTYEAEIDLMDDMAKLDNLLDELKRNSRFKGKYKDREAIEMTPDELLMAERDIREEELTREVRCAIFVRGYRIFTPNQFRKNLREGMQKVYPTNEKR
jgi:hypothetical protein